jgi:hypothetical protein
LAALPRQAVAVVVVAVRARARDLPTNTWSSDFRRPPVVVEPVVAMAAPAMLLVPA